MSTAVLVRPGVTGGRRARKRRAACLAIFLTCLIRADGAEPASDAVVLPPMIVAESAKAPPWLYAQVGGTEYLSRCSAGMTRTFINAQQEAHQLVRVMVPEEFLAKMALPTVSILLPLAMKQEDDAMVQTMLRADEEAQRREAAKAVRELRVPIPNGVRFLPNLRLDDRDLTAVFSYIDDRTFDGDRLIAAPDYVQFLLVRRTPMLPLWLIEGITAVYQQAEIRAAPITLLPFTWLSRDESASLRRDPESRRVLMAPEDLFSPGAVRGDEPTRETRAAVWRAQCGLFVRWALDARHGPARAALWKFVDGAARRPVDETWFSACFGFGFAELRDKLSDYLPVAVKEAVKLDAGKRVRPSFEIKPATTAQIARLRGEWERLQGPYVKSRHPEFAERYVAQARRTLQRGLEQGERSPRMLAAAGLCELDAGDPVAARPLLEEAVAGRVVGPRAYYELARLRWTALMRDRPEPRRVTREEIAPLVDLLHAALAQPPPLPEAWMLLADAWLRCPEVPPMQEVAALDAAAATFRGMPGIGFRVALLHARQGRPGEAEAILANGIDYVSDAAVRDQFERLLAAVRAEKR